MKRFVRFPGGNIGEIEDDNPAEKPRCRPYSWEPGFWEEGWNAGFVYTILLVIALCLFGLWCGTRG